MINSCVHTTDVCLATVTFMINVALKCGSLPKKCLESKTLRTNFNFTCLHLLIKAICRLHPSFLSFKQVPQAFPHIRHWLENSSNKQSNVLMLMSHNLYMLKGTVHQNLKSSHYSLALMPSQMCLSVILQQNTNEELKKLELCQVLIM